MRVLPATILREIVKPVVRERHLLKITVSTAKILRYTDAGIDLPFAGAWWLSRRFKFDDIERSYEAAPDSTTLWLDNVDEYFTRLTRDTDLRKSETIIYTIWLDSNMDILGATTETDLSAPIYGVWDRSEVVNSEIKVDILDESIKAKYCRLRKHSPNCSWVFKGTECTYVSDTAKTITVSIASPAIVSLVAHALIADTPIVFATSGALPTGMTAGTTYYVISAGLGADTFQFSATLGGAAVNTSGGQSGIHTVTAFQTWCDFTPARCVVLTNYVNFGGFQWLLDLKNKDITWGGKQKQWKYR